MPRAREVLLRWTKKNREIERTNYSKRGKARAARWLEGAALGAQSAFFKIRASELLKARKATHDQ